MGPEARIDLGLFRVTFCKLGPLWAVCLRHLKNAKIVPIAIFLNLVPPDPAPNGLAKARHGPAQRSKRREPASAQAGAQTGGRLGWTGRQLRRPLFDGFPSYCYSSTRGDPWLARDLHYRHPFCARTQYMADLEGFVN